MMVHVILSVIEVSFHMLVGMGLFIGVYGRKKGGVKACAYLMTGLCFIMELYNNYYSQISLTAVVFISVVEGICLWIWSDCKWKTSFSWCLFYNNFYVLCILPALILVGVNSDYSLAQLIRVENILIRLYGCVILLTFFLILRYNFRKIKSFLRIILSRYLYLVLAAGIFEWVMGIGLWNLGIDGFSTHVFWLAVLLILCLIFLILFLGVFLLYKIAETKLSIMYINEKSIKQNFRLIMQEQDKIRKINHDRKYEFQYLLECMEKEEYQKGKDYIIEKYAQFKKEQMVRIWTGCNGIDNLLNNAGSQAKKKCVELMLETEIMESPIKEYDFFAVLGNLLDNAIDAAAKCDEGRRSVELKLYRANNITVLSLKNSYSSEPKKKKGKFLSAKEGREHGWGIENVKGIVERNQGRMDISYGDGIFTVQVTFGM